MKPSDLIVSANEVSDTDMTTLLNKIEAASSDSDLQSVVMEEMNTVIQCGFTKPLHRVSCSDKIDLIQTLHSFVMVLTHWGLEKL